jgi:hypothetical protein
MTAFPFIIFLIQSAAAMLTAVFTYLPRKPAVSIA